MDHYEGCQHYNSLFLKKRMNIIFSGLSSLLPLKNKCKEIHINWIYHYIADCFIKTNLDFIFCFLGVHQHWVSKEYNKWGILHLPSEKSVYSMRWARSNLDFLNRDRISNFVWNDLKQTDGKEKRFFSFLLSFPCINLLSVSVHYP